MNSILQNTAPLISESWYEDGEIVDPGTVTIGIVRADGSEVVAAGTATDGSGAEARTYDLALADTAVLGELTATWTSAAKGALATRIAVVGGFYFTIAEFRARYADDEKVAELSAEQIAEGRATAEEIIEGLDAEDGTHIAFVPRGETFETEGSHRRIDIPRYRLRSVESLTVDGQEASLADVRIVGSSITGRVWAPRQRISVGVTHGHDAPPGRIKDAAIVLAYHRLVNGPIDDRATGRLSPEGSVITLATPGIRGSVTGIPEVDAAIAQYAKPPIVPMSVSVADPYRRDSWVVN